MKSFCKDKVNIGMVNPQSNDKNTNKTVEMSIASSLHNSTDLYRRYCRYVIIEIVWLLVGPVLLGK